MEKQIRDLRTQESLETKEAEEGKERMCKAVEELAEKWAGRMMEEISEKIREEAMMENQRTIAGKMLADGLLPLEMIAKYAELPLEIVEEMAKGQ